MPAPLGNTNARRAKKDRLDDRINFALKAKEKRAWKKAAKNAGFRSVAAWIRDACNLAAGFDPEA